MDRSPAVFSVDDVAERWGVNHKTIRAMLDRGELRHFRVGRIIKISEAAIAEYEGWSIDGSGIEEAGTSRGKDRTELSGGRFVPVILTPPNSA